MSTICNNETKKTGKLKQIMCSVLGHMRQMKHSMGTFETKEAADKWLEHTLGNCKIPSNPEINKG